MHDTLPPPTIQKRGSEILGTIPCHTEEEARQAADDFRDAYRWSYSGVATVLPPNDDRPYWLVSTVRSTSCD